MSNKHITAAEVGEAKVEIVRRCGNYSQNLRLDGIIMEVNFLTQSVFEPITWFLARRKMKRIQSIFDGLVYEVEDDHERRMEEINRWLKQLLEHQGIKDNKKNRRVALREMRDRWDDGLAPMGVKEPLNMRGYMAALEDLININEHPAHQE